MTRPSRLRIRLFGPFGLWWEDGEEIDLRNNKAKALLAMLVTAPDHRRTRTWLQEQLWGYSGPEHGRASLRQCLSAMKKLIGAEPFEAVFLASNDSVRIRKEWFTLVGTPTEGEFLEGLDIPSHGYREWVREMRACPPDIPTTIPAEAAVAKANGGTSGTILDPTRQRLRPVVAIIPFAGLDREGLGSHFGDAIAQDITRSLSRSPFLMVISHLSSRNEQLRTAELSQLKHLLSADYVITGHVRLHDQNFRLDVDFVDAASGQLCWTRDFSGKVRHFFEGSDEVVQIVADAITHAVFNESLAPLATHRVPDIETHRLMMAGITLLHRHALGSFAKARECLEEVVKRAPRYSFPHAWLAKWYIQNVKQGWSVDEKRDIANARDISARALDLNPVCPFSLAMNGFVQHHTWRFDSAFSFHEEALTHDPNHALAWLLTGVLHTFMGDGEAAVANTQRARRLSPLDPHQYFFDCVAAGAHAVHGEYETALSLADRSLQVNRAYPSTLRIRAFSLEMLGRHEEARKTASEIMRVDPAFTIAKYRESHPSSSYDTNAVWSEVLGRTGIPLR